MDLQQLGQQEKFRKAVNECHSLGRKRMVRIVNDYFNGTPLAELIRQASSVTEGQ